MLTKSIFVNKWNRYVIFMRVINKWVQSESNIWWLDKVML